MSTHTRYSPAPWRLIPATDNHGHIILDAIGDSLAALAAQTGDHPPAEQAANARLIAAAPDLLAALEAALAAMDVVAGEAGGDLTDREVAEMWNAAREAAAEALARAIGGEG